MKKVILSGLMFAGSAFAGDMGAVHSSYDFGGIYGGVGAGVISIYAKDQFTTTRTSVATDVSRATDTLVMLTGDIGYGQMVREKAYLGVKGSMYYAPQETSSNNSFATPGGGTILTFGNNTYTSSYRPIYNIDAVLGYEFIPHLLPFVEAGVTFADVNRSYLSKRTRTDGTGSVTYRYQINLDKYTTGYNVGLGLSYQPHKNWFLTSEVLYTDLGSNSGSASALIPGTLVTESQTRNMNNNALALLVSASYLLSL